jgi:hypothetical protein
MGKSGYQFNQGLAGKSLVWTPRWPLGSHQFSAMGVAPSVGGGLGTRPRADWPDILTTPPAAATTGRKCKFGGGAGPATTATAWAASAPTFGGSGGDPAPAATKGPAPTTACWGWGGGGAAGSTCRALAAPPASPGWPPCADVIKLFIFVTGAPDE